MAVYTIVSRGKRFTCNKCGMTELEWVATGKDANGKPAHWRVIPYGTNDFSGKVHALTSHACQRVATAAAPAPTIPVPVPPTPVDLTTVHSRIDNLDATIINLATAVEGLKTSPGANNGSKVDALEQQVTSLVPILDAIGQRIDGDLITMRARVDLLDVARPISISVGKAPAVNVGRQHEQFANLVTMVAAVGASGVVYLKGEAGSFKSSIARPLADALTGGTYDAFTFNLLTAAPDILGYYDAHGKLVETPFRRRYEHGGLMFCDEVTRASAEGAAVLNGMTANGETGFPDGLVKRHPECYFVAAGNTFGRGNDAEYIGGNQLDAATLSRFVYLPWDTDWSLLGELYGAPIAGDAPTFPPPGAPRDADDTEVLGWGAYVKHIRDVAQAKRIRAVISSRAFINGIKLLRAGVCRDLVEYSTLWAHMSDQDAATIKAAL